MYLFSSNPRTLVDSLVGSSSISFSFLCIALVLIPALSIVPEALSSCVLTFDRTSPNALNSVLTADKKN